MLFGQLLTHTAQIFADLRTYWSPESVERVSGKKLQGHAENGILHLINSGPAALDGTGCQLDSTGKPTMKPFWEISEDEITACNQSTTCILRSPNIFLVVDGLPATKQKVVFRLP